MCKYILVVVAQNLMYHCYRGVGEGWRVECGGCIVENYLRDVCTMIALAVVHVCPWSYGCA